VKLIIAGSRDIEDYECLWEILQSSTMSITEIVSGKARGVDTLGENYARDIYVPVADFPAQWDDLETEPLRIKTNTRGKQYNALAGFARNERMAQYADACVILRREGSKGSLDMLKRALSHGMICTDCIYHDNRQVSITHMSLDTDQILPWNRGTLRGPNDLCVD
jgi:hypothetical protein